MVDTSRMLPDILIQQTGFEDAEGLAAAARDARAFLMSHKWCKSVKELYLDGGMKYIAVFFAVIDPLKGADDKMWVIVGDYPPAYIDIGAESAVEALQVYVECMSEWVDRVENGQPTDDVIPVLYTKSFEPVEESLEIAEMVKSRLSFIEENIIPNYEDELKAIPQNT